MPNWEPDKELVNELGEYTKFGGYEIRLPIDYELLFPKTPEGIEIFNWHGATRKDGTTPTVQVMLLSPPAGSEIPSLEVAMEKMLGGIKRARTEYKQTEIEFGTINDLKFARAEWNGNDSKSGLLMRGIKLVANEGNKIIDVSVDDVAAHFPEASKIRIASALTLRKQK